MTYALIQLETYGDIPGFLWERMLGNPWWWGIMFAGGLFFAVCKAIADSQDDVRKKRRLMAAAKKGRGEGDSGTDGMTKAERGQYWTEPVRSEKQRERQEKAWRDD